MLLAPRPGDVLVYGTNDKNKNGKRDRGEIGHTGILVQVPGFKWPAELTPDLAYAYSVYQEALKWIGQGIYELGTGGRNPKDGTPFDKKKKCDCSGFVCHCLGIDRFEDGDWWNTDAIKRDGKAVGGRFEPVNMTGSDLRTCQVVHCQSRGNKAVIKTMGTVFYNNNAIVCRLVGPVQRAFTVPTLANSPLVSILSGDGED